MTGCGQARCLATGLNWVDLSSRLSSVATRPKPALRKKKKNQTKPAFIPLSVEQQRGEDVAGLRSRDGADLAHLSAARTAGDPFNGRYVAVRPKRRPAKSPLPGNPAPASSQGISGFHEGQPGRRASFSPLQSITGCKMAARNHRLREKEETKLCLKSFEDAAESFSKKLAEIARASNDNREPST